MIIWSRPGLRCEPMEMLLFYSIGANPFFLNETMSGPMGWVKFSHRGIQRLDNIHIGEKQKRDVFSKKFEFRINQGFEECLRCCADLAREGVTWLNEDLMRGYGKLHEMGFCHSFEAWQDGKLAGGAFGVQLGSLMIIESIFHRANNAGKAAYVRGLLHLKERGFDLVDLVFASDHLKYWGAEWVPQWQYEKMLRGMIGKRIAVVDGTEPPILPRSIRMKLPIRRATDAVGRRLRFWPKAAAI